MVVELFKKRAKYVNAQGEEKTATNFYVKCGDQLIPVEVKYFEDKQTHEDKAYGSRKTVLSAFADELPERENKKNEE